jgi:hypothetical protein
LTAAHRHGAHIEGDLDCSDGRFVNQEGRTVNADHATIIGTKLRAYLWLHIVFGWVLTMLFVLGFTGFIEK